MPNQNTALKLLSKYHAGRYGVDSWLSGHKDTLTLYHNLRMHKKHARIVLVIKLVIVTISVWLAIQFANSQRKSPVVIGTACASMVLVLAVSWFVNKTCSKRLNLSNNEYEAFSNWTLVHRELSQAECFRQFQYELERLTAGPTKLGQAAPIQWPVYAECCALIDRYVD